MHKILATFVGMIALIGVAMLVTPPARAVEGNILPACGFSHHGAFDPIASPGVSPTAHDHAFFGFTGTNPNTVPNDIRDGVAAGQTTCAVQPFERVAYWHPSMVMPNGSVVQPLTITPYYRNPDVAAEQVGVIPYGLRHIQGNANNTNPALRAANWACGAGTFGPYVPPASCTQGITETFFTPNCWDGVSLDNATHKTLVACDAMHPVHLPAINLIVKWPAGTGGGRLESDIDAGVPANYPGITAHYDGMFAFITSVWDKINARCINLGHQCRPVTNAFTKWPLGSIADVTTNANAPALTAAEAAANN